MNLFVRRLNGSHDTFCVKSMMQFFTLSAGGALATAFMFVKLNQTCDGSNNIRLGANTILIMRLDRLSMKNVPYLVACLIQGPIYRFIHDYDGSSSQCSLCADQVVEIHQDIVAHVPRDDGSGGPPWDHS